MPRHRGRRIWAVGLVLALGAAACGDDDGSTGAGGGSTTAVDGGGAGSGAPVVVPQVGPDSPSDGLGGTIVDVGAAAEMGPLVVTVESIEPDASAETVAVRLSTDNASEATQAGPDVFTVCVEDGRFGLSTGAGDFENLEVLDPGAASTGVADLEVPAGCSDAVVQVRVLPVEPGGDHIARYPLEG